MGIGTLLGGGIGKAAEGVGKAVSGVVGTIWGDKGAEAAAVHERDMATTGQYAAEFRQIAGRTWFDSLVDGLNRLVRPAVVGGLFYLWALVVADPTYFGEIALSMQLVPAEMWGITAAIVTFYFGGRPFEKLSERRSKERIIGQVKDVVAGRQELRKLRGALTPGMAAMDEADFQMEMADRSKPLSNAAILEWNERRKAK